MRWKGCRYIQWVKLLISPNRKTGKSGCRSIAKFMSKSLQITLQWFRNSVMNQGHPSLKKTFFFLFEVLFAIYLGCRSRFTRMCKLYLVYARVFIDVYYWQYICINIYHRSDRVTGIYNAIFSSCSTISWQGNLLQRKAHIVIKNQPVNLHPTPRIMCRYLNWVDIMLYIQSTQRVCFITYICWNGLSLQQDHNLKLNGDRHWLNM